MSRVCDQYTAEHLPQTILVFMSIAREIVLNQAFLTNFVLLI